ncbi:hypothetical protein [Bradyrhizobium sp. 930_D9_N1_4]|uniref:hypothetical protein n=1 Tax=Bradyrhizobium sp. 930_D9_N1_4 TaxID=3240374 RepID=UPI003F89E7ED
MFDLRTAIQRWSPSQQREILYFLVRYFKQAQFLKNKGKNIFDDVFDRFPSQDVHDAALSAMTAIETDIGQKASEFDDATAAEVLDFLLAIEDEIADELTDYDIAKASSFFKN